MATHSSVLAWRIPGTEEPGGLPSMGSHRVGHMHAGIIPAPRWGAGHVTLTNMLKFSGWNRSDNHSCL